jgi:hypothetical protein
MRTIAKSRDKADEDAAIALLKKLRVYPLSQAANPPEQKFIDASGKLWNGIPVMDESFYTVLSEMINAEPVLPRDLAMMGMLSSLGIEKGKDFKPDAATNTIFNGAAAEAKRSSRACNATR